MAGPSKDKLKLLQQMLEAKGITKQAPPGIPSRADPTAEAPLSYGQHRMWFVQQLDPQSSEYNDTLTVHLRGRRLDPDRLRRCIGRIVERHTVLRTSFVVRDGAPRQRILPALEVPLRVEDLRALDAERQSEARTSLWLEEARGPFRLDAPPLIRTTLALLADDACEFGLTMHHIVSDGVAYTIFFDELGKLYHADERGADVTLPPLSIQFADYAAWERDTVDEDRIAKKLPFWRRYLGGALPMIELPTDRPRPDPRQRADPDGGRAAPHGAFHRLRLEPALFEALQEYCKRERVTSNWVLLASYFALWHSYSGQTDMVIGTPSSIRGRTELEPLIGFFVQTLILRLDLGGNPDFAELIRRAQRTALEVATHEEVPFDRIFQAVRPGATAAEAPLIHAWIAPMKNLLAPIRLPEVESSYEIVDPRNARFDIALILDETPDHLTGYWEYDTDLFEAATVQRIDQRWQTLLRQVLRHRDTTLRLLRETLAPATPRPAGGKRSLDLSKIRRRRQ